MQNTHDLLVGTLSIGIPSLLIFVYGEENLASIRPDAHTVYLQIYYKISEMLKKKLS